MEQESTEELGGFNPQITWRGWAVGDSGEELKRSRRRIFRHTRAGGGIDDEPGQGDLQQGCLVGAFGLDQGLPQPVAPFQILPPAGQPDGAEAELGDGQGISARLAPFLDRWHMG